MHRDLWAIRKSKGKTQSDVAAFLGISERQYGAKERGKASLTLDEAQLVAKFLETPIDKLFPEYFFSRHVPKMHKVQLV
jgi:transcriptional regulator with XRE-family HTH domain